MEIASLAVSSANYLLSLLTNQKLRDLFSSLQYQTQLDELSNTVESVKAALQDAEKMQNVSSEQVLQSLQNLKDAVYDADDLFDEVVTLAEQKMLLKGGNAYEMVSLFSACFSPCGVGHMYSMFQRIEKIKKNLENIADNHKRFDFSIGHEPSCSMTIYNRSPYVNVYENNIIGREDELNEIVGILTGSDVNIQQDVSYLSIVGIGGLGKTALAKLVFNHTQVRDAFPTLRMWTCVSDHEQCDVDKILRNILASSTSERLEGMSPDDVKNQLQQKLGNNKYLLVLDDVWTENCYCWLNLEEILKSGQRGMGSWIVLTTRSHKTARIVGSSSVQIKLKGLSEENSWSLFQKVAFRLEQSNPPDDFVEIGKKIVKWCAGVPLALRVVGSLLCGQDKKRWQDIQDKESANIKEDKNGIMPILKLSFHYLESPQRNCFTYCALFPKDSVIDKAIMISLWMAQGYIVPSNERQSKEDIAEEYFSVLLQRSFFQDVEYGEFGEIISCKIHDLMHDMAQNVAGKEFFVGNSMANMDKKIRHLALMRSEYKNHSFTKTQIRSYFHIQLSWEGAKIDQGYLDGVVANFTCVRALDLRCSNIRKLPRTIGELLHLRYLNLSDNKNLEVLPKSMKKLYNLETLKLSGCSKLKNLPKHLSKLVNLRVLDISSCYGLASMPNVGKLIKLHTLPEFVMSKPSASCKEWFDQLEDLKDLENLKGRLTFRIQSPEKGNIEGRREQRYLKNKEYLNHINFFFREESEDYNVDETATITEATLLEELHPHPYLKSLELWAYHGVQMPSWASALTNLVRLELTLCVELQQLTGLGDLHHLEDLRLLHMPNLEYITESNGASVCNRSLKRVLFSELPKLKGWVKQGHQVASSSYVNMTQLQLLYLPHLKSLEIYECKELISFPLCPSVECLMLSGFNNNLVITRTIEQRHMNANTSSPTSLSLSSYHTTTYLNTAIPNLSEIFITGNVTWLNTLPRESFQQLIFIKIRGDDEIESLGEIGEVFRNCSSSLQELSIHGCEKLVNIWEGLVHLTSLKKLRVEAIPNLTPSEGAMNWIHDASVDPHSLRSLVLNLLPKLKNLPDWIQYLNFLETLDISFCKELESMPAWMSKLTSLGVLCIFRCSADLEKRCQNPTGEDWPYIKNIAKIDIDCKEYGEHEIPPCPPLPPLYSI